MGKIDLNKIEIGDRDFGPTLLQRELERISKLPFYGDWPHCNSSRLFDRIKHHLQLYYRHGNDGYVQTIHEDVSRPEIVEQIKFHRGKGWLPVKRGAINQPVKADADLITKYFTRMEMAYFSGVYVSNKWFSHWLLCNDLRGFYLYKDKSGKYSLHYRSCVEPAVELFARAAEVSPPRPWV